MFKTIFSCAEVLVQREIIALELRLHAHDRGMISIYRGMNACLVLTDRVCFKQRQVVCVIGIIGVISVDMSMGDRRQSLQQDKQDYQQIMRQAVKVHEMDCNRIPANFQLSKPLHTLHGISLLALKALTNEGWAPLET